MSLSEQEQRTLREIEQSLLAEDPKFGSSVPGASSRTIQGGSGKLTMRSAALAVLGLVLLLGGVALASLSTWFVVLSVLGFVVMFLGGIMALRSPSADPSHPGPVKGPGQAPQHRSKMEENFKRRFEGQ